MVWGILCLLLFSGCEAQTTGEQPEYVPIELFTPAYKVLSNEDSSDEYDLNATIRIIRGLELARNQSNDFESFLEYLSKQDYRGVAKDVMEAQLQMLPVLQRMYQFSLDGEAVSGLWPLEKNVGDILLGMTNDILGLAKGGISGIFSPQAIIAVVNNAFNKYIEAENIKKSKLKELNEVKAEYISALQQYWPVFFKYKSEWESLCIKKDQAYLDLYTGRIISSFNIASDILERYPEDKDGLLIQAMSLVNRKDFGYSEMIDAQGIVERYMDLYPSQTAPAFLIKGIISARLGNADEAFSYFDHASIEYPRQAAALSDMLDAYLNRPYFLKTKEGLHFQQMYRSTISGFGQFSPNFQKAVYFERNGRYEEAAHEIYNHFFRRSNQAYYDYLLSDLEYCEIYLRNSFRQAYPESSLIEVKVNEKRNVFGKRHLQIDLTNNTEAPLNNVRLFICYHLIGMYPGDYVVKQLPPVNVIDDNQSYSWDSSDFPGSQIVYTRGILFTDSKICWIDSPQYRREHAVNNALSKSNNVAEIPISAGSSEFSDTLIDKLSYSKCRTFSTSKLKKEMNLKRGHNYLMIWIPQEFCMINPYFTLGAVSNNVVPERITMSDKEIVLIFPYKKKGDEAVLTIYGDGHRYDIKFNPGENESTPNMIQRVW